MHSSQVLLFFSLLASSSVSVTALPLNINLGAYSPALVVGDGEISFGGKQDVSNLMNALEGAAVNNAAANAATPAPAAQAPPAQQAPATAPEAGLSQAQAIPVTTEQQQAAQIASLQGLGNDIAPRVVQLTSKDAVQKRDLAGFDRALKYAADALRTSPGVELGTGEGGSGVGIKVAPGGAPAAAQPPAVGKRDETSLLPKMKTVVTTMFVRGGPAPAANDRRSVPESSPEAIVKREPSPSVIDGVNLNMAEGQVAELTFVETKAVDDFDDNE